MRLSWTIAGSRLTAAVSVILSACTTSGELPGFGASDGAASGGASMTDGSTVGVGGSGASVGTGGSGLTGSGGSGLTGSGGSGLTGSGGSGLTGSGGSGLTGTGGSIVGSGGVAGGVDSGIAPGCSDSDGDGIDDCTEDGDGDPWTDRAIFNGVHVRHANQCSGAGSCDENDTLSEVNSCMQNPDEELDQYSGWDWGDSSDSICSSDYAFLPNWNNCDSGWAADWQGCIHLASDGPHCFQISGDTDEGCAALYFNGNSGSADVQTGTGAKCFDLPAGNYPILWHYTMDQNSNSSMHVQYCDGAGADCTPSTAIPSSMLRTSCP